VTDRPQVCVGAVALDDDRLLLIRRGTEPSRGRWSVPGGRVEGGETLAEAVVRELREEAGLEGVCGELVGWVERFGEAHHFVIMDFRVEVLDAAAARAGDDAAEVAWVPVDDVATWDLVPGLAEFLHDHGVIPTIV
jgi:8-oxo-dGTP diphosphatase